MELWHAAILGIIEGVTEFLPISSTGHLLLGAHLLEIAHVEFVKTFEIAIQLGAILAVITLYPKRLLMDRATITRVITGFIPTAVLGLLFYKIIKTYLLGDVRIVLAALFLGGIFILFFEHFKKTEGTKTIVDLSLSEAAAIGALQAVAFIPGVSRSVATIFGGLWNGLSRKEAVEFSFFLAVPTMAAATGLDLLKNYELLLAPENIQSLLMGFVVSFLVALCAIKFLVRFVSTHRFKVFGYYRIGIALIFLCFIVL